MNAATRRAPSYPDRSSQLRLSPPEKRRAQRCLALHELREAGDEGINVERFAEALGVHRNVALAVIAELQTAELAIDFWIDEALEEHAKIVTEGGQR